MPYISRSFKGKYISAWYDECGTNRALSKKIYDDIASASADLKNIKLDYDDMLLLIPSFGSEEDSLGANSRVNIEKSQHTMDNCINRLDNVNNGSIESTKYYKKAKELDEKQTLINQSAAEEELSFQERQILNGSYPEGNNPPESKKPPVVDGTKVKDAPLEISFDH